MTEEQIRAIVREEMEIVALRVAGEVTADAFRTILLPVLGSSEFKAAVTGIALQAVRDQVVRNCR